MGAKIPNSEQCVLLSELHCTCTCLRFSHVSVLKYNPKHNRDVLKQNQGMTVLYTTNFKLFNWQVFPLRVLFRRGNQKKPSSIPTVGVGEKHNLNFLYFRNYSN